MHPEPALKSLSEPGVRRPGGRARDPSGPWLLGRLVAATAGGRALVTLVPLAHASPPDPTWIRRSGR